MNNLERKTKTAEDKGFYIILFLCIAAIGIASYVLFFTNDAQPNELSEYTVAPSGVLEPENTDPIQDMLQDTEDQDLEEDVLAPVMNQKISEETETKQAEQKPSYARPVFGEVVKIFSSEELQYDQTMGDWRTHMGTDFACKQGDRVYAIGDGIIEDISEDETRGTCVSLLLEDGKTAIYTGLNDSLSVAAGDRVMAGDAIGSVGDVIETELVQGPHLHIELVEDDVYYNIEELLPKE